MAYEWRGPQAATAAASNNFLVRGRGSQQAAPIDWGQVASNAITAQGMERATKTKAASDLATSKIAADSALEAQRIKSGSEVEAQRIATAGAIDTNRLSNAAAYAGAVFSNSQQFAQLGANAYQNLTTNQYNTRQQDLRAAEIAWGQQLDRLTKGVEILRGGKAGAVAPPPAFPSAPMPTIPAPFRTPVPGAPDGSMQPSATVEPLTINRAPLTFGGDGLGQPTLNPSVSSPQPMATPTPQLQNYQGLAGAMQSNAGSGGGASSTSGKSSTSQGSAASFGIANLNSNARGWLAAIRRGEGTEDEGGYNRLFGGGTFDATKGGHPDKVQHGGGYSSAAAGAYQFMPATWNEVNGGNAAMTPENQDRAAMRLARAKGVDLETAPFTPENVARLAPTWASLPNGAGLSHYNQPVKSFEELRAAWAAQQQ